LGFTKIAMLIFGMILFTSPFLASNQAFAGNNGCTSDADCINSSLCGANFDTCITDLGLCQGEAGNKCDDQNQCSSDICDPGTGDCTNPPDPFSQFCSSDDDECTIQHCDGAGSCVFLSTAPICQLVAGSLTPIDTTMVLAAGVQSISAWMFPIIVSAAGIAIVIARKFSKYQPE